jgi:hypothetical protein
MEFTITFVLMFVLGVSIVLSFFYFLAKLTPQVIFASILNSFQCSKKHISFSFLASDLRNV